MSRPAGGRRRALGALLPSLALLGMLSACGLPGEGSLRTVDDDTVPYRLLEDQDSSAVVAEGTSGSGPAPRVFWLVDDDRLVPSASDASCGESSEVVVEGLLRKLAAGPSDEARVDGRSTAIPPESALALVGISEGTARVEIDPEPTISAERLPAALGQIVLSVTSAPGVRSVTLLSDAAAVQVPLPGGALTDEPVTAGDYQTLLPDRLQVTPPVGCPDS